MRPWVSLCTLLIAPFIMTLSGCETTDKALTAAGRVARGQTGQAIIDLASGKDPAQIAKKRLDQYARDPEALLRDLREAKKDFEAILAVLGVNVGKTWGKKEVQLPERKKYVKYTQNYKSRAIVDFDAGDILVETLDDQNPQQSLKSAIVTTLLTPQDPRSVDLFSDKEIVLTDDKEPYLFGLVLDQKNKPIRSPEDAEPFAAYLLEKSYATRVVDQEGTKKTVHYVTMDMVSNLPMKMVHCAHHAGGRHERQVQRRRRQIELGVVRCLLLRRHAEDLPIELNRSRHVVHIERDMRSHEILLSSEWEKRHASPHFYRRRTPEKDASPCLPPFAIQRPS
ncbi:MAG: DUF3393 domain-containing protein [Nitrospira sp.]|nr:MAG: DUF3393 domain-containing protein [Nitrospira sp.]